MKRKNSDRSQFECEELKVPPMVHERVERVLGSLPEVKIIRFRTRRHLSAVAAVLALILLFVIPNISPAYAAAAEKIPIVGKLVQVVTVRNYLYREGRYDVDLKIPEVQETGTESINQDISSLTDRVLQEFYEDLDLSGYGGYGSVHMDYQVIADTEEWFTLKLCVTQINASSNTYFKFYHIDKNTGKIVTLGDLFQDSHYAAVLEKEIKSQMALQMARDHSVEYWIQDSTAGMDFVHIGETQNYYWKKDGSFVIVFDKYEVGPGSAGCPEFAIPADVVNPLLKPEFRGK